MIFLYKNISKLIKEFAILDSEEWDEDLELELFVKIRNVETLTLSVHPSISIYEIKTQIESLREIPRDDQILTLNGTDLDEDFKFSKSQIENSVVWLSYRYVIMY